MTDEKRGAMAYRTMEERDLPRLVPLYMDYYNGKEGGQWTWQTTEKRIRQVLAREHQGRGIGTAFMQELEARVKKEGAIVMLLNAVNDSFHEHFYGKLGFETASNLVIKTKTLQ